MSLTYNLLVRRNSYKQLKYEIDKLKFKIDLQKVKITIDIATHPKWVLYLLNCNFNS